MYERRLIVVRICDKIYTKYERKGSAKYRYWSSPPRSPEIVSEAKRFIVHEIGRDEAHSKAFEGVLKRYFG